MKRKTAPRYLLLSRLPSNPNGWVISAHNRRLEGLPLRAFLTSRKWAQWVNQSDWRQEKFHLANRIVYKLFAVGSKEAEAAAKFERAFLSWRHV